MCIVCIVHEHSACAYSVHSVHVHSACASCMRIMDVHSACTTPPPLTFWHSLYRDAYVISPCTTAQTTR
jgi:hypothetical protein